MTAVTCWLVRPGGVPARHLRLLDDDDRARAARLRSPAAASRFVRERAALRAILAASGAGPAEALRLSYGPAGKPLLPGGPAFSITHAGERSWIAVCADAEVGIDVVAPGFVEWSAVGGAWFAAEERAALAALPPARAAAAASGVWCRREALVKAAGTGMAAGSDFVVSVGGPPRIVAARDDRFATERWSFAMLAADAEFDGAVAVAARAPHLTFRDAAAVFR